MVREPVFVLLMGGDARVFGSLESAMGTVSTETGCEAVDWLMMGTELGIEYATSIRGEAIVIMARQVID